MFSHDLGRFDPFAAPSGNGRYLREADGRVGVQPPLQIAVMGVMIRGEPTTAKRLPPV